ncbi:hypothetical protein F7734_10075 [Scytonema sp. UIC 10036]|uniref:hypothetical protein n=1 Tax=Scytonema sp. UIC 10036 TaxID=2304196 RepID=UPI0012DA5031|nr:hypothetical protein [Scytonema sp. UIC 10036]MUG92778.1 hypothetical protein [Scytonema sp. UIC 10036]
MSKGTGAAIELGAISALFIGAVACTLSSLSKQPYDLVEIRFCPPSANGLNSKEQKELDEHYCRVPRYVLKEAWDSRGLFGSSVPVRDDVKFKRLLPTDNLYQHIALTGTALCLAGISFAIAIRNNLLQNKYYNWLEELKTAGFTTWNQQKSQRELIAFNQQLNTQLKADVAAALDNQTRVQAGLTNVESLEKQQQKQETLANTQYDLMIAELRRKIAEENSKAVKAEKEINQMTSIKVTLSELPTIEGIDWWDWGWLETKSPDDLPHLRLIGATGSGKTTLADWVLDKLPGDCKVLTVKRKPQQWQNKVVVGVPEDFESIESELIEFEADRKKRLSDVAAGIEPELINICIDEWRAIKEKVEPAVDIIRDTLALSREARQRLILMAQGRQVKTFGLKDESDLEECMASFYIGKFAIEESRSYYSSAKHLTEESKNEVIQLLEKSGNRAVWVSTSFGVFPGVIPEIKSN